MERKPILAFTLLLAAFLLLALLPAPTAAQSSTPPTPEIGPPIPTGRYPTALAWDALPAASWVRARAR